MKTIPEFSSEVNFHRYLTQRGYDLTTISGLSVYVKRRFGFTLELFDTILSGWWLRLSWRGWVMWQMQVAQMLID